MPLTAADRTRANVGGCRAHADARAMQFLPPSRYWPEVMFSMLSP
jgi:hypothetical protein